MSEGPDFPAIDSGSFDEALAKQAPANFDEIPTYETLNPTGRGPGIGEDLTVMKTVAILNQDIAIMGYIIRPSTFAESDGGEYASVEIMDASGSRLLIHTSSKALMETLERRFERNEIPFKTQILKKLSPKSGREFYSFQ